MGRRFHGGFTAAEKTELWDRWKRGESLPAGEGMERFARNELRGDPSFELDAMGTVSGHGFRSPAVSVNPNL